MNSASYSGCCILDTQFVCMDSLVAAFLIELVAHTVSVSKKHCLSAVILDVREDKRVTKAI
jgi:hypothetical protein